MVRRAFEPESRRVSDLIRRTIPVLRWAPRYTRAALADDALAAVIVTIMLIPQSLAYALIAGMPPEAGLYASILPLVAYTIFGTSTALAVGPVAVISLMTAATVGDFAARGSADYASVALALAFLTGLLLIAMGALRLGFLANFLSHPIMSAFITASGVLIAAGQMKHILGVEAEGDTLIDIAASLAAHAPATRWPTLALGAAVIGFLVFARSGLKPLLLRAGLHDRPAAMIARAAPLFAVFASIGAVAALGLDAKGVAIVGDTPKGFPPLAAPPFDPGLWRALLAPALLIAVIGYVESVSVAQMLAAKRNERVDLDQELIGLGAANLAAGVSGGFPVTGGFARSVVNFDAGARTPAAGGFAAIGISLAALYLTPLLHDLPRATLAATIIVAVLALVDIRAMRRTLRYSRSDFAAMAATVAGVFLFGVEAGVVAGVVLSILFLLHRASRPHSAIVGQVPGTQHFRNVRRHDVITSPSVVSLRIDGDFFFANARFIEERILEAARDTPGARHVVLMCSAVNVVDMTALEALETVNTRLKDRGVAFHLSEVKGPVMDKLKRTHFLEALTGAVHLSEFDAMRALDPLTFEAPRSAGIAAQ
ncbi:MAG TPA: sodium-independent anion transporter [Parvularcula sp.]|nr:sodium-independent anion transporter [Parvularcula sp.]HBS31911.1 sodium-independent anion transporter [Parvularcula sp.]HBS34098.1 sodium-independent anion transporter [Parvularcula sp.]